MASHTLTLKARGSKWVVSDGVNEAVNDTRAEGEAAWTKGIRDHVKAGFTVRAKAYTKSGDLDVSATYRPDGTRTVHDVAAPNAGEVVREGSPVGANRYVWTNKDMDRTTPLMFHQLQRDWKRMDKGATTLNVLPNGDVSNGREIVARFVGTGKTADGPRDASGIMGNLKPMIPKGSMKGCTHTTTADGVTFRSSTKTPEECAGMVKHIRGEIAKAGLPYVVKTATEGAEHRMTVSMKPSPGAKSPKAAARAATVAAQPRPRVANASAAHLGKPEKAGKAGWLALGAWSTSAGGTGAAEGKYGYTLRVAARSSHPEIGGGPTQHGPGFGEVAYYISPFTRRGGKHAGYMLQRTNQGGPTLTSGLYAGIAPDGTEVQPNVSAAVYSSPQAAYSAAKKHYDRYIRAGVFTETGKPAPSAAQASLTQFLAQQKTVKREQAALIATPGAPASQLRSYERNVKSAAANVAAARVALRAEKAGQQTAPRVPGKDSNRTDRHNAWLGKLNEYGYSLAEGDELVHRVGKPSGYRAPVPAPGTAKAGASESKPKRKKNAYMIFAARRIPELREGGMTMKEAMVAAGKEYREMNPAQRARLDALVAAQ